MDDLLKQALAGMTATIEIAENALNTIEDGATDVPDGNARMISLLGYFAGMTETVRSLQWNPPDEALFNTARALGRKHAIYRQLVTDPPKGAI